MNGSNWNRLFPRLRVGVFFSEFLDDAGINKPREGFNGPGYSFTRISHQTAAVVREADDGIILLLPHAPDLSGLDVESAQCATEYSHLGDRKSVHKDRDFVGWPCVFQNRLCSRERSEVKILFRIVKDFGECAVTNPLRLRCGPDDLPDGVSSGLFLDQLPPRPAQQLFDERCRINPSPEIRVLQYRLLK